MIKPENFEVAFTVELTPVSKKNSIQILTNRATGRPFLMPSKNYVAYEKAATRFIPMRVMPIDYPVNVQCLFYMPTKRRCDLTNMLESIDDVMVKAGLLKDDNFNIIAGHDGSRVLYDKERPRTEVIITRMKEK